MPLEGEYEPSPEQWVRDQVAFMKADIYDGEQPPPEHLTDVAFYVMPYAKGNTPRELIPGMTGLRAVLSLSAGVEKLLPHIRPEVAPSNGRDLHDAGVAEHALALVLAAQPDLPRRLGDQAARRWAPHVTRSLADTHAIIVGYGSIGAVIEHRLLACGAEVVRVASRRPPAERVHGTRGLPQLLPHADIVILELPQSPAIVGLMDGGLLALLPDDALVLNGGTARYALLLASYPARRPSLIASTPTTMVPIHGTSGVHDVHCTTRCGERAIHSTSTPRRRAVLPSAPAQKRALCSSPTEAPPACGRTTGHLRAVPVKHAAPAPTGARRCETSARRLQPGPAPARSGAHGSHCRAADAQT
ncbi:NAD(P)-dependent oxidoreductase [Streptomyces sp. NPDC050534]|uniref:NAD(P)-dependent oxidoreductase n=1 Tax=Streptomyces sp. NPDC050534 TaxID=3365625 RepID=UPI003794A942